MTYGQGSWRSQKSPGREPRPNYRSREHRGSIRQEELEQKDRRSLDEQSRSASLIRRPGFVDGLSFRRMGRAAPLMGS